MLGEVPGFRAVGEVGRIWDKGVDENMACSCGQPFRSCGFWGEVGERAFGGWDDRRRRGNRAGFAASCRWPARASHTPWPCRSCERPELWPAFRDKAPIRRPDAPIYQAMHEITDGAMFVDSMKIPAHVYLMTSADADLDVESRTTSGTVEGSRTPTRSGSRSRVGSIAASFRGRRPPWRSALQMDLVQRGLRPPSAHRRAIGSVVRYEDLGARPHSHNCGGLPNCSGSMCSGRRLGFVHDDGIDF